jgi:hypothetical protein
MLRIQIPDRLVGGGSAWLGTLAVLLATALGFVLSPGEYLRLVALAMLLAVAATTLVLRLDRPSIAMLMLVASAVAFPFEFRGPAGVMMGSSLPLASAICAFWMLRLVLERDTTAFDRSRILVAASTFLGLTLVSFLMGQFPWFPSPGAPLPAQIVELGLFTVSVLLFLLVGHQVRWLRHLEWLTWIFIAAGSITCVVQMTPALASTVGRVMTRPMSVGSLYWTWFVAMTLSQGLANRQLPFPIRMAFIGLTGLAMYHGVVEVRSWASGWLPAAVAAGAIIVVRWPRPVMVLSLLALPVGLVASGDVLAALLADESYSLTTRLEAWRVLWQIAERSPWLGSGLANYYYFAENYPILGWYVPFISHNNYQDLLVQTGLLGLLAFCWFGLEAVWMTFRLSLQSPPGFARAYAIGALGGAIGSLTSGMLGDWIIPFYYNAGVLGFRSSLLFWVFLGGALALRRQVAASRPAHLEAHSRMPALHHAVASFR